MIVGSAWWKVAKREAMRSRVEERELVRNSMLMLLVIRLVVSPVSWMVVELGVEWWSGWGVRAGGGMAGAGGGGGRASTMVVIHGVEKGTEIRSTDRRAVLV